MWWYKHIWIIAMQVIAFIPYIVGSHGFYRGKKNFMYWLALGLFLDAVMAIAPMIFRLPRMEASQGAPWGSLLFIIHIATAGIGMFGFMIMFIYLLIRGTDHYYGKLRRFQYHILLKLWMFGVVIALLNFLIKVLWNVRIYDYL